MKFKNYRNHSYSAFLTIIAMFVPIRTSAGPIHDAVRTSNLSELKILIEKSPDQAMAVNTPDEKTGELPLAIATVIGNGAIVTELLRAGAKTQNSTSSSIPIIEALASDTNGASSMGDIKVLSAALDNVPNVGVVRPPCQIPAQAHPEKVPPLARTPETLIASIKNECFGKGKDNEYISYNAALYPGIRFQRTADYGEFYGQRGFYPDFGGDDIGDEELALAINHFTSGLIESDHSGHKEKWQNFSPKPSTTPMNLAIKTHDGKVWIRCEKAFAKGASNNAHRVFEFAYPLSIDTRPLRRLVNLRSLIDFEDEKVKTILTQNEVTVEDLNERNGSKVFNAVHAGLQNGIGIAIPIGPFNLIDRTYEQYDMELEELIEKPNGITHRALIEALYELTQGLEAINLFGILGDSKFGNILVRNDGGRLHAVWHDLTLYKDIETPNTTHYLGKNITPMRSMAVKMNLSSLRADESSETVSLPIKGIFRNKVLGKCVDEAIEKYLRNTYLENTALAVTKTQEQLSQFRQSLHHCLKEA